MTYSMRCTVEDIHVDRYGRMKSSAILYLAQEAAGGHCRLLGTDQTALNAKRLFWAVTRHGVQVEQLPVLGQTLTVRTWPMPTTRVAYPRATEICDETGKVLVRCISLWVLMDRDKRTMVLPGKSGVDVPGISTGAEPETPRSLIPRPRTGHTSRPVTYSVLDCNGHMNNTHYLDWAADLLDSDFHQAHPLRGFTVCYLNEAREGQCIRLDWELTEEGTLVVDAHRDAPGGTDRVFSVQMLY